LIISNFKVIYYPFLIITSCFNIDLQICLVAFCTRQSDLKGFPGTVSRFDIISFK
jgi:hypothetical protein